MEFYERVTVYLVFDFGHYRPSHKSSKVKNQITVKLFELD